MGSTRLPLPCFGVDEHRRFGRFNRGAMLAAFGCAYAADKPRVSGAGLAAHDETEHHDLARGHCAECPEEL